MAVNQSIARNPESFQLTIGGLVASLPDGTMRRATVAERREVEAALERDDRWSRAPEQRAAGFKFEAVRLPCMAEGPIGRALAAARARKAAAL